jgi:hypothetical protein
MLQGARTARREGHEGARHRWHEFIGPPSLTPRRRRHDVTVFHRGNTERATSAATHIGDRRRLDAYRGTSNASRPPSSRLAPMCAADAGRARACRGT